VQPAGRRAGIADEGVCVTVGIVGTRSVALEEKPTNRRSCHPGEKLFELPAAPDGFTEISASEGAQPREQLGKAGVGENDLFCSVGR